MVNYALYRYAKSMAVHVQGCDIGVLRTEVSSSTYILTYRPHTTVKNARNMKSVSQAKLSYFEEIFKLWAHEQQELPCFQMLISFANQNLAVLCVKRPWNGFRFSWNIWCCMRSILSADIFVSKLNLFAQNLTWNLAWATAYILTRLDSNKN